MEAIAHHGVQGAGRRLQGARQRQRGTRIGESRRRMSVVTGRKMSAFINIVVVIKSEQRNNPVSLVYLINQHKRTPYVDPSFVLHGSSQGFKAVWILRIS
jgi:hypothetical protein